MSAPTGILCAQAVLREEAPVIERSHGSPWDKTSCWHGAVAICPHGRCCWATSC